MVKLLDCTIRDCGYCTNWSYSDEYVFNLISLLNKLNVNYIEIGYRNYYERKNKGTFYYCTPNFIKKFYEKKGNIELGIMSDTKRFNESDFPGAKHDYIDFIRIATHPESIQKSINITESLYNRGYKVMIQLMDITNLSPEHYNILKEWQNKNILEAVYLADTYGIITENELELVYNTIRNIGFSNIGFHAHNKTKKALENSLKAIELGANLIDITQEENGRNGGNLLYKDLIKKLNLLTYN